MSSAARDIAVLLFTLGTLCFSITYTNYESFDSQLRASGNAPGDTAKYLNIYLGTEDPLQGHRPTTFLDYRVVVPYLARLVPLPPPGVFRPTRHFDDPLAAGVLRFAVLTSLLTFLTGVVLFYLCRGFGISRVLSLMGSVLYVGLTFVLAVQGIPHVDAGFFLCFGLAALALQRRNLWLLFATVTVGIFVKEGMVLVALFIVLLPAPLFDRLRMGVVMVPAVAAYVAVRFWMLPMQTEFLGSGSDINAVRLGLEHIVTLNGLAWIFMGFNFLWLPFAYALRYCRPAPILVRWAWSIPVLIVAAALDGSDHYARVLLLAYPAVIPLAVIGIGELIRSADRGKGGPAQGPDLKLETV